MTENDLCRELADALFLRCNDNDSWSQTAREKLLPIIRSYANGLVAAAVETCAKLCESYQLGQACNHYQLAADIIRSTVTPESAAKELGRIKTEARRKGVERASELAVLSDSLTDCKIALHRELAELEAAKEK